MAEFSNIVDIVIPPITYDGKSSVTFRDSCIPRTGIYYDIKLVDTNVQIYSMLESIVGTAWKYLTITNIDTSNASTEIVLLYNASPLTIGDLPLKLDIQTLSQSDIIPNLQILTEPESSLSLKRIISINVTLEDINGDIGNNELVVFQFKILKCGTTTYYSPIITSSLEETLSTGDSLAFFTYQITTNKPVTSYEATNLPTGASFNTSTGYLVGNLLPLQLKHTQVDLYINIAAIQSNAVPDRDDKVLHIIIPPKIPI